jgi:type I restriction enzyme, S subunit
MDGWTRTSIGRITTFNYGKSLPADARIPGSVPVYGSNGIVGWHNQPTVNSPGIIVGRKGTVGAVRYSLVPFCPIDTTYFITQDDSRVDLHFLAYLLQHAQLSRLVSDLVPGLNRDSALASVVSIPSDHAEQRQIATVLQAVQMAVERQVRLIALTAELKQAVMHKLFTEGVRGEQVRETEIGLIPASWTLAHVGDLGKCITGTTPSTKVEEFYSNSAYCFISPADLGRGKYVTTSVKHVSQAGLRAARVLPRDCVLCVCIGSSIGKTGMTWHEESCTNQQINSIDVIPPNNPHFVFYLLAHWADHWRSHATFGPVPILSKGAFEKVRIPFTQEIDVQGKIAETLSAVDAKIELHTHYRESLASLFRTLLHQLMTAQVRVHDFDLSVLEIVETAQPAGAV